MSAAGPIAIRTATAADVATIAAVFRSASLDNDGDRPHLLAHPELLELDPAPVARGRVRVAEIGGAVVGFATTEPLDDSTIELVDLFVAPAWMRHGAGRALVADAADRARADGATQMTVDANDHALAFYTSVGFGATGTVATRFGPTPRMRLDLAHVRDVR